MTFPFPLHGQFAGLGNPVTSILGTPVAFDANSAGWTGYTVKVVFPIGALAAPSFTPTRIRARLYAATTGGGATLDSIYIGHKAASGDAYDADSFTEMLTGGASGAAIPVNDSIYTDWTAFSWNKTSGLVLSAYMSTGAADDIRSDLTPAAGINGYYKVGNSAATADDTGMTNGARAYLVGELHVK